MSILLYELAGADDHRIFSPFCWRIRMALLHKGLDFKSIPWRFSDKEKIAHSGQSRVPVLEDGDTVVSDSWAIACYLDDHYPNHPSLFGGKDGQALSRFYYDWVGWTLQTALVRLVLMDIFNHLHPNDKAYFRHSREHRFGMSLEQVSADRDQAVVDFRQKTLVPLRETLQTQAYLGGDRPLYADYIVFGAFQWARAISPFPLLDRDDPIYRWRDTLLDAFDGAARQSTGYAV